MTGTEEITHVLDGSGSGFVSLDAQFRYRYVNGTAEQLLGRKRGEMLGRSPGEVFPEARGTEALAILQRVFELREAEETETYFDPWDRWFRVRLDPLPDGGILVQFDDITQARKTLHDMRESGRHKDEFLATLAHELRNPLAPIRHALELLQSGSVDDPRALHRMMDRQLKHLTRLVDDLLELSRINRGKVILQKEPLDVRNAVNAAVEAVRPEIDKRNQALIVHLPSDPAIVHGDPVRLTQVVTNLLNNASKYTPDEGQISVEMDRTEGEVEISVSDTGIGIAEDVLARVFEPYLQGDSLACRDTVGLGLGLTVVRRLTEQHGGTVSVRSEGRDRGSRFSVTLPLRDAPESSSESLPPATRAAPGSPSPPSGTLRVVVVDDNRDAADSLRMLLVANGCDARVVYAGEPALDAVLEDPPDVLILDIGLPDVSGYDVARRIRQSDLVHQPLIIALTGWGQQDDRAISAAAGIDHHLVKPADWAAISDILARDAAARKSGLAQRPRA